MSVNEMATLQSKIEELRHGYLRPVDSPGDKSYLVDAFRMSEEGEIFVFSEQELPVNGKPVDVSLKFIDKENGEYLVINGTATKANSMIPPVITVPGDRGMILKVHVSTAQYFQREEYSSFASNLTRKAIWKLKQGWRTFFR